MMKFLKGIAVFLTVFITATVTLTSCENNKEKKEETPTFTVKGNISNGANKKICVYQIESDGFKKMGEAKLDSTGNYSFNVASPKHFEFYLLDVENSGTIVFIADSTETITIDSDANDFVTEHTIGGNSENQRIKEITILRAALEKQAAAIAERNSAAIVKTDREIRELIEEFKQNIIKQYIYPAPESASAYYALTLTFGNTPIFTPMQDRNDSRCFAAVATNFQHKYPGTSHTKYLTKIAEKGLAATRPPKIIEVEESEALTTGIYDIRLPQANGDSISLSSLVGKGVMLDFTFYENTEMGSRNIMLRELYNKYRDKGFDIYQVSIDENKEFWKQSAANLPWTCVHDTTGASTILFNVQSLPTFYLISKSGEVLLRDKQIEDLEKEIEELLK